MDVSEWWVLNTGWVRKSELRRSGSLIAGSAVVRQLDVQLERCQQLGQLGVGARLVAGDADRVGIDRRRLMPRSRGGGDAPRRPGRAPATVRVSKKASCSTLDAAGRQRGGQAGGAAVDPLAIAVSPSGPW